jgi:UDP-GlcNAc:undecaprenyl-phosphate GlcNAc-1-phosphate transferase
MDALLHNYIYFAPFVIALFISLFAVPNIMYVAKRKRLFDIPDNKRKVHTRIIPNLGGIGIFFSYIIVASLFTTSDGLSVWNVINATALILFLVGLKDDLVSVSPYNKFIAQIASATIIVLVGGLRLDNLHGILGLYELPYVLSCLLTIIGITFMTNAINLIDGIDGLAGTLSLLACLTFGVLLAWEGNRNAAIICFSLAGAIAGFLYYNVSPAKIFMGDTGSLLLGYTLAIIALIFAKGLVSSENISDVVHAPVSRLLLALAILWVPIFDTIRLFTIRLINKKSPFRADRNHLHHYLLDVGCTHSEAVIVIAAYNFVLITLTFFLQDYDPTLVILTLLAVSAIAMAGLLNYRKKKLIQKQLNEQLKTVKISAETKEVEAEELLVK